MTHQKTSYVLQDGIGPQLSKWLCKVVSRLDYNRKESKLKQDPKEIQRPERRLGIFYLANDVVQNGRKKAKDLVTLFGEVFKKAAFLLNDAKIKSQVERTFNIWLERSVYDNQLIETLKQNLGGGVTNTPVVKKKEKERNNIQSPVKSQPSKSKPVKPQPVKSQPVKSQPAQPPKTVPPNFKVSNLLVSVKKNTSLDNDIERKSKALENLKIDASSYDSVKHIKDRSSVGKFFKQFEESKVILDDYIHALRKSEKDKHQLLTLLDGGEAFYDLAQQEAKVIVNAYKTFGNRLNSMKKKLDSRIKKMSNDQSSSSLAVTSKEKRNSQEESHIQDMELDSDSDCDVPTSQQYNPNTAPAHDEFDDSTFTEESNRVVKNSNGKQFFNPNSMNGMTSFLGSNSINAVFRNTTSNQVSTPMSESSAGTPEGMIIADVVNSQTNSSQSVAIDDQGSSQQPSDQSRPLKNLIDTLFPVLSKSLQTIKEKQQAAGEESKPSVNDAIAFALGDGEVREEIPRKKSRFSNEQPTSPVSLTNPKGLSENQTELISIAAGLTKFDENFLPVTIHSNVHATDQAMKGEEESLKSKSEDHEKRRDERKSRHSSGRHRSSYKDDDRHKRSSSRSPRRSSHRSRDDRHPDRRRSRRSQSPKRRRGSRGRRSSSRDRDELKRRYSPDSKMAPYYNDRRSPTPELDSSSHNPSPSGQYTQQVVPSATQVGNPITQVNNPILSNAGFAATHTSNDGQPMVKEIEQNDTQEAVLHINENIINPSGVTDAQDPNTMLHLTNPMRPSLQMNTMLGLRPVLTPFTNPLHLLQQQPQPPDQHILHLRPIGPGLIPFNQSQNMMPNSQLTNDNLNSMNRIETNMSDGLSESQQGLNPLQALSQQNIMEQQQQQQEETNNFHGSFEPSFTLMGGPNDFPPPPPPPEFPGPPPRPPNFRPVGMDMGHGDFRPLFRPKFAERDPLLDQLEAHHRFEPPIFNRPRFRPRFDRHPDVRFGPRYGPAFPGPIL